VAPVDTACGAPKEKKEEAQGVTVFGADPKAFGNARDLLPTPRKPAPYTEPTQLPSELGVLLSSGELPEKDKSRCSEILRSVSAVTGKGYQELRQMAEQAAKRFERKKSSRPASVDESFAEGNRMYERGAFSEACAKYGETLCAWSEHLDARNNLALAEIHQGHNALAVFHLIVLKTLAPDYAGADINLSVALERLGLSEEAYSTGKSLADKSPALPAAQYNLAWFENARGRYAAATKGLEAALRTLPDYDKAKHLYALNELEAGRRPDSQYVAGVPDADRARIRSITPGRVSIPATGAELFDGSSRRGVARLGEDLIVSSRDRNWIASYWQDSGVKHRYWIQAQTTEPPGPPAEPTPPKPAVSSTSKATIPGLQEITLTGEIIPKVFVLVDGDNVEIHLPAGATAKLDLKNYVGKTVTIVGRGRESSSSVGTGRKRIFLTSILSLDGKVVSDAGASATMGPQNRQSADSQSSGLRELTVTGEIKSKMFALVDKQGSETLLSIRAESSLTGDTPNPSDYVGKTVTVVGQGREGTADPTTGKKHTFLRSVQSITESSGSRVAVSRSPAVAPVAQPSFTGTWRFTHGGEYWFTATFSRKEGTTQAQINDWGKPSWSRFDIKSVKESGNGVDIQTSRSTSIRLALGSDSQTLKGAVSGSGYTTETPVVATKVSGP
jgi:Flp pilus assembly protein TadD